jgi:hypothetical protein
MPGSSGGIFLSYRREDTAPYARLLQVQLSERIPDARVFMDLDSIEAGLDFAEVIREAVDSCAVLVALIGQQWATIADEEGHRRLDNPDDYVRFEVETALERGARVIPVLVDGAKAVRQEQLPSRLQKLARLNAFELSLSRYKYDADRLLDLIQEVLAASRDLADVDRQAAEDAERKAREEADRKAKEEAELIVLAEQTRANGNAGGVRGGAPAAGRPSVTVDPIADRPGDSPAAAAPAARNAGSPPARARLRQRYFLICLIFCLILFIASFVGINKAPPRSGLSYTMGWVIGLSLAGALLSLVLLLRARRHSNP